MNFNFRHVEIFSAVMSTGSATAAASLLHTSQPTISRELARFEKLTGLRLFERSGGKLAPTEQALMLHDEVQRSYVGLQRIASAADAIRNHRQWQLSVACLPAFSHSLLPQACRTLQLRHPGIQVSITPLESPGLHDALSAQRYHLGLTEERDAPPGTVAEILLQADLVAVLPEGHPLCGRAVLAPADFEGTDFICLAPEDPYRLTVDGLLRDAGVTRRMAVETHSAGAVCATVALGAGIAIVNPLTALEYGARGVRIRPLAFSVPYTVSMVTPGHRPASAGVLRCAEILRETCQAMAARLSDKDGEERG